MIAVFHIGDRVVTGDLLAREHKGERAINVIADAILTPTAWDYIRQHRLQVVRGQAPALSAQVDEESIEGAGRCDHPNRSCGCEQEEFGSGYVEPASCSECAVHARKRAGDATASCEGCNRHKTLLNLIEQGQAYDPEELIREVSDMVLHRLEK